MDKIKGFDIKHYLFFKLCLDFEQNKIVIYEGRLKSLENLQEMVPQI